MCEQITEGHVLVLTSIYSQDEFERNVICLATNYINPFKICQKPIIYSLPRCLKKPLETLCISNCELSQSDLDYLPYCLNISELKHLQFSDIRLCDLFLEPLGFLLERVRDTLQTLELESCFIEDSQLNALLPALSQCSHLTDVNFYDNNVSLSFLKQLLHHTANLSQLTQEEYPAPQECYDDSGVILTYQLENFCPELLDILRAKRQPNRVVFETTHCSKCGGSYVYDLENQCCIFVELF